VRCPPAVARCHDSRGAASLHPRTGIARGGTAPRGPPARGRRTGDEALPRSDRGLSGHLLGGAGGVGSRSDAAAGEDVEAQVAAAFGPFVVLFGEHGANETDE